MADKNRIIVAMKNLPALGRPVKIRNIGPVVVESFGKSWILNDDDCGDTQDLDGERVCYAYVRDLTELEAYTLNTGRISFEKWLREEYDEEEIAEMDLDLRFDRYQRDRASMSGAEVDAEWHLENI
jgi:hypothetical protein